jgi:hypothetical protein
VKSKRSRPGATLLHGLGAEHPAQRCVKQVRTRVVAHGGRPCLGVYRQLHPLLHVQRALDHAPLVHDELAARALGVAHLDSAGGRHDRAAVAHLAPALGVEGRLFDHHPHLLALARHVAALAVHDQRAHVRGKIQRVVAEKGGGEVARDAAVDLADPLVAAALPGRPRPLALRLHGAVEPGLVEVDPVTPQDVGREVHRKAEGVIELEDRRAGERLLLRGRELLDLALQEPHPLREGL